jgi:aspartyl/asparaginyl-tRNA synthetase
MSESLPERPKEDPSAPSVSEPPQGFSKGPSKSALKKAAKEKEKAEKAAKRAAEEQKAKAAAASNDVSKDLYGKLPPTSEGAPETMPETVLEELTDSHDEKEVMIEANVDNARVQSAKLGFLVLRQELDTIQAVISESPKISRPMVKWASSLNRESVVRVYGLVQKAPEPVLSATVSNLELHIQRIYLVAEAAQQLPLQIKDVMATPLDAEEGQVNTDGTPIVTLNTRLNNRVLDLRSPRSHAIFSIEHTAVQLFTEYMTTHGAKQIFTPKMLGAATEGGSNVFDINYFGRKAFLAQSPQLYKQMLISSGRRRVFEIAPVFRAENSNTHRHLTEVWPLIQTPFYLTITTNPLLHSSPV